MRATQVAVTLALAALALLLAPPAHATDGYRTLVITNDAQLDAVAASDAWPGTGTPSDPYVLQDKLILATNAHGIDISGTTKSLLLARITVTSGGPTHDGIRLVNVRNVTIVGATVENMRYALYVKGSTGVTIQTSTARSSAVGLFLDETSGVSVTDDRLALNDHDVEILNAHANTFSRNDLATATGQEGVHFDDAISYDNAMDTSNVVNAQPIRWYAGLAGTTGAPIAVAAPVADLRGVTNVAQVLLFDAKNVTLDHLSAKAGLGVGVLCVRCENVTIADATIEGNAGNGVQVDQSRAVRLVRATLRSNGGAGLAATGAPQTSLVDSTVDANGREGVRALAGSDALSLQRDTIDLNRANGVLLDGSNASLVENTTLYDNAGADIALNGAVGGYVGSNTVRGGAPVGIQLTASSATLDRNTLRGHGQAIRLTRSTGSVLTGNAVELSSGQTAYFFDDEASYDNRLDATNTANGQAVRWIARAMGTIEAPIVLPNLVVNVPGITNVAQIMVYRSANVTLTSPAARDGAAMGILLYSSERVRLDAPAVSGNARNGIDVESSGLTTIVTGDVRSNVGHGIQAGSSSGLTVENTILQGNRGRGLSVELSPLATIRGNGILGNTRAGIFLDRTGLGGATIDNNVVQGNTAGGIFADSSAITSLRENNVSGNADTGIQLTRVPAGAIVSGNRVANHASDIRLTLTNLSSFADNVLTILPTQRGFVFDDEMSYENAIPPSNTVNDVPLRWYVGASGTFTDAQVELKGITNLAQVMVYRSPGVTLVGANATNGTDRGIYVYKSSNVTLLRARAADNAGFGIAAEQAPDLVVQDSTMDRSGREGLYVWVSARSAALNVTVRNGTGRGVLMSGGDGMRFQNSTIENNGDIAMSAAGSAGTGFRLEDSIIRGNRAGGVSLESLTVSIVARNTIASNGEFGLSFLSVSANATIRDNVLSEHAKGMRITGSPNLRFFGNAIAPATGGVGYHFAEGISYAQSIDTSNTVSGVPMRWIYDAQYTTAAPLVVSDIAAGAPGMTNVAQVMVYASKNVTLERARVGNASANGIYVLSSDDVSVNGTTVTTAGGTGIVFQGVARGTISNSTVTASGGYGAIARQTSGSFRILGSTFRGNALGGAYADSVPGLLVNGTLLDANRGSGLTVTPSAGTTTITNVTATSNGANGIGVGQGPTGGAITVTNDTARSNAGSGISISGGVAVVRDDVASQNGLAGIALEGMRAGTVVTANELRDQPQGIRLVNVAFADISWNNVTIGEGQYGFYFEDEASFNNVIALTNLVNGVPVRWYTALSGTEGALLGLPNVSVELRGITNVAQVMVYRSSYVRIPGLVATNGTGRGLYLYRSSNILVEDADLSGNHWGAHLQSTQSSTLRNITARDTSEGVRLSASLANWIQNVDATGASLGVEIADAESRGNVVQQIETTGTARGVVDPSATPSALRGSNLVIDAGAPKLAKTGVLVNFTDALGTARFDAERISSQSWTFGDTQNVVGAGAIALRPSHAYGAAGAYRATYSLTTLDGQILNDSVTITIIPPLSAPAGVVALPGDRLVNLTWSPPAEDGAMPILKYRVFRGVSDPAPLLAEVANATTYNDTAVANGVTYHYQVSAVTADGEGPRSAVQLARPLARPSAPASLVTLPNATVVNLTWTPPLDNGGAPVTGYRVLRANESGNLSTLADLGNVTSFRDSNVTPGSTFRYAVQAKNAVGLGNASVLANATLAANDTLPPLILSRAPEDGARTSDPRPRIDATYVDNSGVVLVDARLDLDGAPVDATFSTDHASYQPSADLAAGAHTVRLVLHDAAGNVANVTWSFTIGDASSPGPPALNGTSPAQNATSASNATDRPPANDTVVVPAPPIVTPSVSYGDLVSAAPASGGRQKIPGAPLASVLVFALAVALARRRR